MKALLRLQLVIALLVFKLAIPAHAIDEWWVDNDGDGLNDRALELPTFHVYPEPTYELDPMTVYPEPEDPWTDFSEETAGDDWGFEWTDIFYQPSDPNTIPCETVKDRALMAKGAYDDSPADIGQNKVVAVVSSPNGTGFSATIYNNSDTGVVTVAFRGTEATSIMDWVNNGAQSVGALAPQYLEAMTLAQHVQSQLGELGGTSIEFVGHSLGGGLASAAATVTGEHATTYNAAGLNPYTTLTFNGTVSNINGIDAFYVGGEVLSTIQDNTLAASAAGTRHRLEPSAEVAAQNTIEKHSMDSVIASLGC